MQRRLNEAGAKYNRPMLKPLLTERHRENRLQWAQDYENTNWDRVIFSDETTVRMNSVKGMVWNLSGKRKLFELLNILSKPMFGSHRLFQTEPKCRLHVQNISIWPLTNSSETVWFRFDVVETSRG